MTDSLVDWLQAQLDDDERAARDCIAAVGAYREGEPYEDGSGIAIQDAFPSYPWGSEGNELTFMAGPGHPARVLAEVAAKRDILDVHHNMNDGDCAVCVRGEWGYPTNGGAVPAPWPCMTIKLLALPYAGRDGWRDEWRPQ